MKTFEVNGIKYEINSDGISVTVIRNDYSGIVIIPPQVQYLNNIYRVTSIGYRAFFGCGGITSLTIPDSVTSIGVSAFDGCSDLERISVDSHNAIYDSRGDCNAIIETATNTLIAGCKNTTIPDSMTSIGEAAFFGCSGITSLTIPNSVTSIGDGAFHDCSGITSLTIPNSVTSIGDRTFSGCNALTEIKSFAQVPPTCYNCAFDNINKEECILYVPKGQIYAYKQADEWKDFVCIKEM